MQEGHQAPPLKKRSIGCPETSVRNCHYSLRNNPAESISRLLRGAFFKFYLNTKTTLTCHVEVAVTADEAARKPSLLVTDTYVSD